MATRQKPAPLPTKEQILEFVRESPGYVGRREIARAFRVAPGDRAALRAMLKELTGDGLIERGRGRRVGKRGALPTVTVLEVTGVDADGELMARPVSWQGPGPPPKIYVAPERRGGAALGAGERMLARLRRLEAGVYEARIIRRIRAAPSQVLGVYTPGPGGGRLKSTARRYRDEIAVADGDSGGARAGELVLAEMLPGRLLGLAQARVVERLGDTADPRSVSLIAIHAHDIPTVFPAEALAEAAAAAAASPEGRVDLRQVPLITIDDAEARDFDDAVWAEADPDPGNPEGWRLLVAIADVAHYVGPGSALDRRAAERGNSVYFPDRVVPMLPEALSNDLCSLRPGEDRACLAARIRIDAEGRILDHRFERGLMRSAARLTYEEVQAARDGRPEGPAAALVETAIAPAFGAYRALAAGRERRGALDIELPERRVVLAEDGRVASIEPRPRLESHRLIEEFMIAANVAAAETLEERSQPCMYRVHDAPDPAKVAALREVLAGLGIRLAKGQVMTAALFNRILRRAEGGPHARLIHELVLRSQSQAAYAPDNLGHFGLALRRYAHFTSPIRRYADILVHRALIAGLGLGTDGLAPDAAAGIGAIGEHISMTERRATAAERDARDRFVAAYLADRVGAVFAGAITGVTRFGIFVSLDETGADGLVPMSALPADYYIHHEDRHALIGDRHGRVYTLGDRVEARLAEADPITGSLVLQLMDGGEPRAPRRGGRAKPAGRRRRRRG